MLSSGCARPESIRDAMTKIVHFGSQHCVFYPSLCSLLWGGEVGTACPRSSACPMDGQARVPRMGQAGTPVTKGRPGCGALGQRVRQNRTKWCLCLLPPEGW